MLKKTFELLPTPTATPPLDGRLDIMAEYARRATRGQRLTDRIIIPVLFELVVFDDQGDLARERSRLLATKEWPIRITRGELVEIVKELNDAYLLNHQHHAARVQRMLDRALVTVYTSRRLSPSEVRKKSRAERFEAFDTKLLTALDRTLMHLERLKVSKQIMVDRFNAAGILPPIEATTWSVVVLTRLLRLRQAARSPNRFRFPCGPYDAFTADGLVARGETGRRRIMAARRVLFPDNPDLWPNPSYKAWMSRAKAAAKAEPAPPKPRGPSVMDEFMAEFARTEEEKAQECQQASLREAQVLNRLLTARRAAPVRDLHQI